MKLPDPTRYFADPWNPRFLSVVVLAAVIVVVSICIRDGADSYFSALLAVVSAYLAITAYGRFRAGEDRTGAIWLIGSMFAASIGVFLANSSAPLWNWLLCIAPMVLMWYAARLPLNSGISVFIIIPALFASVCLGAGAIMDSISSGAFPAAFAFFYSMVVHAMRRFESEIVVPGPDEAHPEIHHTHRHSLARISILFFIFGVICFWPWLGRTYGDGYFWVTVGGVLFPVMLYWGRLRQPRTETSFEALVRFNRIAPYLGLIMVLALAVG